LKEAEQNARAAVAVDGESAEAWDVLGRVLFFKGDDYDGAREALERSLALNPNSVLLMHFLSICYLKLGDQARANDMRTRAVSLSGGELPMLWQA
jgi:uncharacterized protein HemY